MRSSAGGGKSRAPDPFNSTVALPYSERVANTRQLAVSVQIAPGPAGPPEYLALKQHPRVAQARYGALRGRELRAPEPFNKPVAPPCFERAANTKPWAMSVQIAPRTGRLSLIHGKRG